MAGNDEVANLNRPWITAGLALILAACAPAPPREPETPQPVPEPAREDRPARPPPEVARPEDPLPEAAAAEQAEPEPAEPETPRDQPEPAADSSESAQSEAAESSPTQPREARAQATQPQPELAVSGTLQLTGGDADPGEAVVFFVADGVADGNADDAGSGYEIATEDKALSPTVMAVPVGAEVRFPNNDPILHNLFSVSPENDFDLGVYGPGEAPSVRFDQPGVVNIYCNVHHDMHAHVLVVDTPWRTRPDTRGHFRLDGLPPGSGQLHVWHRQSERWSQTVELPLERSLEISLPVTRPRLPPHRDKTGQPYNRRDRDPYR